MNALHAQYACERLQMFLERELLEGRPLTETEKRWLEAERRRRKP